MIKPHNALAPPSGRWRSAWTTGCAAGAVAMFAVGCAKPYVIVRAASPNPFVGETDFVLLPVDYSGAGAIAASADGPRPTDPGRTSVASDEAGIDDQFHASLRRVAADNGITIRRLEGATTTFAVWPHVRVLDAGVASFARPPSDLEMTVTIVDEHGTELDRIVVRHRSESGSSAAMTGPELRTAADAVGASVALYLRDRTAGYGDDDDARSGSHLHRERKAQ